MVDSSDAFDAWERPTKIKGGRDRRDGGEMRREDEGRQIRAEVIETPSRIIGQL